MDKSDKKKKDRLDGIIHDIKSPLGVLKSYFSYVPSPEDADCMQFHVAATRSLDKLCKLIDMLNDPTAVHSFKPEAIDLVAVITEAMERLKPSAKSTGILLSYVGPSHAVGNFDADLIDRLITNLVKNAIEAFDSNNGKIHVSLHHDEDTIWVEVGDNAKGIPKECLSRIFEKNFTYGKKNGTGIGLDVCRDIVGLHGGKIMVHSIPASGTVFTLSFPSSMILIGEQNADNMHVYVNGKSCTDSFQKWMDELNEKYSADSIEVIDCHSPTCFEEDSLQ